MDPEAETELVERLRSEEGISYVPYEDTTGNSTVGVGHDLQSSPLPYGWSYPLTDDQVNQLLATDLQNVYHDLNNALPWWIDLNDPRQIVLCDMCFNMGLNRLLGFKNALAFMRQGNYANAASEMLRSAWADQVGQRAINLAHIMETGVLV